MNATPVYPGCTYKSTNACALAGVTVSWIEAIRSENARLREQVKELRSALKPFARMASDIHEAAPDNALCVVATLNGGIMSNKEFCTVSDLRRARDLMEKTNG